jgi:hypothetical protein
MPGEKVTNDFDHLALDLLGTRPKCIWQHRGLLLIIAHIHMGSLKKRRKAKINKHKRRKKLRLNRHKKRTWQK